MGLRCFHQFKLWLVLICLAALASPIIGFFSLNDSDAAAAAFDSPQPKELEAFQGYLDPAPEGMDIRYAWTLPGGRGENVRIVDIEVNWNLKHNDLIAATSDLFLSVKGVDPLPQVNVDHGTAVLGELVATPDGVGVTGIAHGARLGVINPLSEGNILRMAEAINRAASKLGPGDVILIEQQSVAGPRFDPKTGKGLIPVEYEASVFDAIKSATSRGIVVVEPAGNGFENLDDSIYNGAFDRDKRDSGAIIVGAGSPPEGIYGPGPDRTRTEESNYGSRVDVQGWGRFVTTCGYGDLRREQGENNWYTSVFGATSAAAAMVAGAAAVLQSIIEERGLEPLSPIQLRRLLTLTGSPQTGDTRQNIGPRPDLRAAIEALDTSNRDREPVISKIKYKKSGGKLIVDGENFIPDESIIEIDGTAILRIKYPGAYHLPDGTITRLMTKENVSAMLPRGIDIFVTVFTPSTGKRSEPFKFKLD